MASAAEQLAANLNLGTLGKATELKQRIWFTLGALLVYRVGTYIPVPGVDAAVMAEILQQNGGGILGMFDMFSGGALGRMTVFALNIMPYISASIIIQLLSSAVPSLEALKKEGESGRKKLNQYTRYLTVLIALVQLLEKGRAGELSPVFVLAFLVIAVAVIAFVVFVERAQRRVAIQYPKRQVGQRMFGGDSTHMPLKVNTAGVIPPIFASSILLIPATIAGFSGDKPGSWLAWIGAKLGHGEPLYMLAYAGMIIFFAYFYTAVVFNPVETADNLKKYGGFIPGVRPGANTATYFDTILAKLTTVGALYLCVVCLLPEILISKYRVPFYFGGTSLMIIVSVTMDTVTQVQSHLLAHQYEGLIRKNRVKGRGR